MDKSLAGPSVAMHQEIKNVDTGHEDKTADDQSKSKVLCEGTEIDTEMHDNEMEVKDPLLGHEEDSIDKLTDLDPKDSEDLKKNNKGKEDSMIHEIQEYHNSHIMAVDEEKNKKIKKTENVEWEIVLKVKVQNKLKKLRIVFQAAFDEESFYICNNFSEISIKSRLMLMMQRNNKDASCFHAQSEQCSLKKAAATSSETSDISVMCDLNSGEVITMKNTQNDKMLSQKHRDTGQHSRTIKEMNTVSSHNSFNQNGNEKISPRPALKSQYLKEHLKSEKKLYMYMQSSYGKESLDAKNWYLEWGSDHPLFRNSIWHVNAVRFYDEDIPPIPHIQLPAPALPLTRFLVPNSGFNLPAARAEVITAGAGSSEQEQSPNQSRETENMSSFSSRVLVEEIPSTTSADEGNGCLEGSYAISLRPSNDDQIEATSSERTAIKGNVDTNKSGSRLTTRELPVDTPSQQIAEARSSFIGSPLEEVYDANPLITLEQSDLVCVVLCVKCCSLTDMKLVAAASTPGSGEIQKYLLTAAAQSVLDMGYQRNVVLRAIRRVLRNRVSEEMTGQMILETVFEIEEEKENKYPSLPSSELEQGNDIAETNSLNNCPTNYTALRDNAPIYGAVGGVAAFTPGIEEMQNYLQTDAAQSVLDMGFQPTIVLLAIDRVLMNRECEELTRQMIMEAAFAIEEEMMIRSPSWLDQVNESTGEGEEVAEGECGEELPFDHKEMRD